jgi:hypothetical protein
VHDRARFPEGQLASVAEADSATAKAAASPATAYKEMNQLFSKPAAKPNIGW